MTLVVAHATTGPYQMDLMDEVPNGTALERFIGIYLDFYPNLAKVRVAGSNPVVRSKDRRSQRPAVGGPVGRFWP